MQILKKEVNAYDVTDFIDVLGLTPSVERLASDLDIAPDNIQVFRRERDGEAGSLDYYDVQTATFDGHYTSIGHLAANGHILEDFFDLHQEITQNDRLDYLTEGVSPEKETLDYDDFELDT